MLGEELLLDKNETIGPKRFKVSNGCIYYRNNKEKFNGDTIKEIIAFIKAAIVKYGKTSIPIVLDLGRIQFEDKLTYIILECICNYIMENYRIRIIIGCSVKHNIWAEGFQSSVLPILSTGKKDDFRKFSEKYKYEIYGRHYRRIISETEWEKDIYLNSKIMEQVNWFLKNLHVERKNRDAMSEVVSELAGNVHDHTNGDCLIDIDVTSEYDKKDSDGTFYGLNLVVINFSETLFGDGVKARLSSDDMLNERYDIVRMAYSNHKKFFKKGVYEEDDFYNISAFQHKISGRTKRYTNGGTGLTKLIRSLEESSDTHNCYMISGTHSVFFKQDYLNFNRENWIGFNDSNDYLNDGPGKGVIGEGYIYFPGTAYNLNFAMRKEENNEKQGN